MGRENDSELHAMGWQARLLVLQRASLAFARLSDVREIGNQIIRVLEQLLPYERSAIVVVDRQSGDLRLIAHSSAGLDPVQAADEFSRVEELIQQSTEAGVIRNVIRTGTRSRVDDVETYPGYIAGDEAMRSELCVPVSIAGRTIGALNVESLKAFAFGAEDEALLTILANQVALTLENAWLTDMSDEDTRLRIQAESERMAAEHLLAEAINTYSDGMALFDENDILRLHNGRLIEIYASISDHLKNGVAAQFLDEVVRDTGLLAAGADPGYLLDNLFLGKPSPGSGPRIVETSDGRMIEIHESAIKTGGRICLHSNITERVKTERALAQAQRVDAIGRLTAGVAHDFNNLLAVIMGNAELTIELVDQPNSAAEISGFCREIIGASLRGSELTRRLLSFARKSRLAPVRLDVNDTVSGMGKLFRRSVSENIQIETSLKSGLWSTLADPAFLESSLLNLVLNARDAMPKGGKLTIETRNFLVNDSYVDARGEDIQPGRYVMLAVSDTGTGIPSDLLEKVIEPFFTTKAPHLGSGLGLAMVHGFVKQSGGVLRIYSEVGVGTTVKILLPATANGMEAATPLPDVASPDRSTVSARILLVEDEPSVRRTVALILGRHGARVTEAENGDLAWALFAERLEDFDLLLTDVVVPGTLQGPALARLVKELKPELGIVFMSGYANEAAIHGNGLRPDDHFLMKPVQRAELMDVIARVLKKPKL